MAVTSYYSVYGKILGEETSGTRRDYLTDALGSVTGTVTSAGNIENTYRYKPYGDLLSKTGAGSDPKFLWVGTKGYRSNQNNYYVRARHYTQKYATWSSQDPLGYVGGTNLFLYSDSNPSTLNDPSGKLPLTMTTITKPSGSGCGDFFFEIKWTGLTKDDNGAIIQHIYPYARVFECDSGDCGGCNLKRPKEVGAYLKDEYYEAWNITNGRWNGFLGGAIDTYQSDEQGKSCGAIIITGFAKFIPGFTAGPPDWIPNYPTSGGLPALLPPKIPSGKGWTWTDANALNHWLYVEWDCCKNPKQYTTVIGSNPT